MRVVSSWKFNTKKELTGDYIAGLVQADGSFSVRLVSRVGVVEERKHSILGFYGCRVALLKLLQLKLH